MKKRVRFIVNPIAGTKQSNKLQSAINKYVAHHKIDADIVFTDYPGHATILTKEAVNKKYSAVVAVGGDGTVNEVAEGLVGTSVFLGIIPRGSGNGLAHYLKIPLSVKKAIEIINNYDGIEADTARINGKFFLSTAGIGFDALVAADFAKAKQRGFWAYLKPVLKRVFTYKPQSYKLVLGNKTVDTKAMMITFANSNQYGYGVAIAPNAKINDGLIDMCVVEKVPFYAGPLMLLLLLFKRLESSKYVKYFKLQEVTVIHHQKQKAHIDGDAVELESEIHVKVWHKSLKILVPAS